MGGFKKKLLLIRVLVLTLTAFATVYSAWASDSTANTDITAVATATVTPNKKTKAAVVQTPAVKKDFKWFFKNGCNCPQCRAFRQQQIDDQQRLKDTFQP